MIKWFKKLNGYYKWHIYFTTFTIIYAIIYKIMYDRYDFFVISLYMIILTTYIIKNGKKYKNNKISDTHSSQIANKEKEQNSSTILNKKI
ncbi:MULTISPECIES: hypothetical protein [unclassified Gemella]|uniref:hypothetical protein n=1 Tax=unclassified Gemella TaxID=2624949 RepID=UPI001C05900A|nr:MULTISPECIES: hypothetical protein [unclassified Gemella]MBU0279000.1 hypothetical protein [Gemella sp. zg-1178]QWQ38736.1 hypothetical protein KMP11_07285 [Gemella sp. zg-570]